MLPVFMKEKSKQLYGKNHNISSWGAKIIADELAAYIKDTTDITPMYGSTELKMEKRNIFQPKLGYPQKESGWIVSQGKGEPYWNQNADDSRIVVFGDCNLQAYQEIGGGIGANLTYNLHYPVLNAGRVLLFHPKECVTEQFLQRIQKKDIIIYVAFTSAGFVRSSMVFRRNLYRYNHWCTMNLQ